MRKPELTFERIVEMGGWDSQFFNSMLEFDESGELADLIRIFTFDQYTRAWDKCRRIDLAWMREIDSIEQDIEDGYREPFTSQGERLMNYEIEGETFVAMQADEFANEFLSTLDFDEIMFLFTYGGCYRFDEPTVSIRIDLDADDYEEGQQQRPYVAHLFRFQTNLFNSTLLLYLEELEPHVDLATKSLDTAAEQNRRYGETP